MKKTVLFIVLILFNFYLFSQLPEWQWVNNAGGTNLDQAWCIDNDSYDNCYITGSFRETATFGSFSLTGSGPYNINDVFVAKVSSSGEWLWASQAGGSSSVTGRGITVDSIGNCYDVGIFSDTASFGQYSISTNTYSQIYVAKINSEGIWQWATQAGGDYADYGWSITSDMSNNIYVAGEINDIASFGSYSITSNGGADIFVAKIDTLGIWQWAAQAGGNDSDFAYNLFPDNNGNILVTGAFNGTAIFGSQSITSNGERDIFIAKLDSSGNWLWVTQAGGIEDDCGIAITTDSSGNIYVTGRFYEYATFGSNSVTSNGDTDIFVAQADYDGNWQWVTQAGGTDFDGVAAIVVGEQENIYIAGSFFEAATFGLYSITGNGSDDVFVAKIDSSGNWIWVAQAGGTNFDGCHGFSSNDYGNMYMVGAFRETTMFGSHSVTSNGSNDIFVAKLNSSVPAEFELIPNDLEISNYPNPFNPTTTIEFLLKNDSTVELSIYNIKGQKINELINNEFSQGSHSINWNGEDDFGKSASSGIYYYQLKVNGTTEAVKKCLLLK